MLARGLKAFCGMDCLVAWCASADARKLLAKAEAKTLREQARAVRPLSWYKARAQKAVNAWVVWRDRNKPCISCLKPAFIEGEWHAGHFKTRGSGKGALDPKNINKQCAACNNWKSGALEGYRKGILERFGPARLEYLETLRRDTTKRDSAYFERVAKVYRRRLKQAQTRAAEREA